MCYGDTLVFRINTVHNSLQNLPSSTAPLLIAASLPHQTPWLNQLPLTVNTRRSYAHPPSILASLTLSVCHRSMGLNQLSSISGRRGVGPAKSSPPFLNAFPRTILVSNSVKSMSTHNQTLPVQRESAQYDFVSQSTRCTSFADLVPRCPLSWFSRMESRSIHWLVPPLPSLRSVIPLAYPDTYPY